MKKFIKTLAIVLCLTMFAPLVVPITETVEAATKPKIKLNFTQRTIHEGETFKLKVTGTKQKVKWSSSNKNVATVSSKGIVTGIDGGTTEKTCKIYAKVCGKKYTCKVIICGGVSIVCNDIFAYGEKDAEPIICEGQTVQLKLTNPNVKPIWTSSNPEAISVTSDGLVNGINGGENKGDSEKCTITATVGKKSYTYDITVKASYISATEITIPTDIGIVLLKIENLYNTKITWTSTDENIVPINDKYANELSFWLRKPGTATVTATTENNKTFQCVFTITPNMYQ